MWIWAKNSTNLKNLTDSEFNQGIVKDSELTSNYVNTALKEVAETLDRGNISETYDSSKTYEPNDIVRALCVKSDYGVVLYEMRYFLCLASCVGIAPWGNNATFTEQNGIRIYNESTMELFKFQDDRNHPWLTIWSN